MSRTIDIIARGMAKNGGGGSGEVSDIKVDGRSIVKPDGTAELATESPYDPESNPLATMNDVGGGSVDSLVEETTWSQLKTKRDAGQLTPGMKYRITDYSCTTSQEGTTSAGHQFDIIVTALDNHTLSEVAKAGAHLGDTYFVKETECITEAHWIAENPSLSSVEIVGGYDVDSEGIVIGPDTRQVQGHLVSITTHGSLATNNIMVPALFCESYDSYSAGCYVFRGSDVYNKPGTSPIQVAYTIDETSEEISYEGDFHEDDIIVEISSENGELRLYKNSISYWDEGVDYEDWYTYEKDVEIDGVTYNKWVKYENSGEPTDRAILTNVVVVNGAFTITQEEIDAALEPQQIDVDLWEFVPANTEQSVYSGIVTNRLISYTEGTIASNNLNQWQLRYCLDNDADRFSWAVNCSQNAIQVFIDNHYYIYLRYPEADLSGKKAWVFVNNTDGKSLNDLSIEWDQLSVADICYSTTENPVVGEQMEYEKECRVTQIPGKGIIYWMKDEYNNEAPFDFKNILHHTQPDEGSFGRYTFNAINNSNTRYDMSLNSGNRTCCFGNIIHPLYEALKKQQQINDIRFNTEYDTSELWCNEIEAQCTRIYIYGNSGIYDNKIESRCHDILFHGYNNKIGCDSYNLLFNYGDQSVPWHGFQNNVIGAQCHDFTNSYMVDSCIVDKHCSNITLAGYNNHIGYDCSYITLAYSCNNNYVGYGCGGQGTPIIFAGMCKYNTIGAKSKDIGFGYSNMYCSIGANCSTLRFANACENISIDPESTDINFRGRSSGGTTYLQSNYSKDIRFIGKCTNISINPTEEGTGNNGYVQNLTFHNVKFGSLTYIQPERNLGHSVDYYMEDSTEIYL